MWVRLLNHQDQRGKFWSFLEPPGSSSLQERPGDDVRRRSGAFRTSLECGAFCWLKLGSEFLERQETLGDARCAVEWRFW